MGKPADKRYRLDRYAVTPRTEKQQAVALALAQEPDAPLSRIAEMSGTTKGYVSRLQRHWQATRYGRCMECGERCLSGADRCLPCHNWRRKHERRERPRPANWGKKREIPVIGPDGRRWNSMIDVANEFKCARPSLYPYATWAGDHWRLSRYPDPRHIGRWGGKRWVEATHV